MKTKKSLRNTFIFIISCLFLIALDQITKYIAASQLPNNTIELIPNFFSFELVWNNGAAFGILQNARVLFCIITIIICIAIEYLYFRIPHTKEYIYLKIIGILLFSGAIGNLIDRVKRGSVIDFIAFDFGSYSFPRFNFADIYVSLSAVALFIVVLFVYNEEQIGRAHV